MKNFVLLILLFFSQISFANSTLGYDPGPDPLTSEGKGYINIVNTVPDAPFIGKKFFNGKDKFRYPFGIMPWRGPTDKNSVKVLVIGQDGTHIAEAAGRPFTGGTGGRLQGAVKFLGIRDSAMYINTFSYTIYGQYADYAPILKKKGDGSWRVEQHQFLNPETYLIGQDTKSPYVRWRNLFIDQIIKANPDSLKLIIVVGGAATDTLATYINSRGGTVDYKVKESQMDQYQLVLYKSKSAGLNRSFFYPIDHRGHNVLLNDEEPMPRVYTDELQMEHMRRANDKIEQMVRLTNGPYSNGFLTPAQLGYDIYSAKVNGKKSLKGLRLNDGQIINSDIRIIQVRHPGSLSPSLSNNFKENLAKLLDFEEDGWEFYSTDDGEVNQLKKYHSASSFNFNAKPPIPVKDFPLGKSKAVIVNSSLASRNGQQIIVFGGREKPYFNRTQVNNAKNGTPAEGREFFFNSQPWNPPKTINQFDRGPGKEWAALFNSVPEDKIFQTKPGMRFESDGIDAYVVKNTPKHGSFAYHRGTTENPEVLIFADPSDKDYDDLYTARALTGENGQYLQGLMSQLGVKENYLIIKTVPFDMTDATEAEWDKVRELLRPWRNKVFAKAIKLYPKLIVTLGKHSSSDLYSYLNDNHLENINFISLEYDRHSFESHFSEMAHQLGQSPSDYKWEMNSIPRSHLPYPMQTWIGTSGARGIRASGKYAGDYYGIVTPYWVIEEANRVYRNPREGLLNPELDFVQFAKNLVREFGFSSLGKTMSSPPLR